MKKNVSGQHVAGQMNSRTDGSPLTSSVSVAVTIDGGTSTAGGGTLTHKAGGHWDYAPTQAETNGDHVAFQFTHSTGVNQTVNVYPTFPQTGDNFARLGAPAGASVSADVAAVKAETASILADTNDIQTRIPAALVSGRMDSSVGAMANNVLTAAAINADAITDAKVASDVTIASVTGAVGSVTGNVGGNVTGSVGSVATGGITRASFAADTGLQTIRSNTAQAGAAGTITLDASASATDDFYNNTVVYITGGTGVGQARHISDYVGSSKVATIKPNWVTTPDNTSTFAIEAETSPWDQVTADHLDSGSTGASLNAAGSAGDPWTTALPGAYGAGTAGFIVGTNLNATVSSRLASASYTAPLDAAGTATAVWNAATATYGSAGSYGLLIETNVDAQISTRSTLDAAGVRSAVGLASANLDAQLDAIPTAIDNADALLNRDMSAVSDTTARSPLNALRFIRNRWVDSGGTLTVYKENDSTTAWTAASTGTPGADPITGIDPA